MAETATRRTWATAEEYYTDGELGERRVRSREVDYGVWWREGSGHGPWWRVSWVDATGELYAICGGPRDTEYYGQVELLASGLSEPGIEEKLKGWGNVIGGPGSLGWVRARVAA